MSDPFDLDAYFDTPTGEYIKQCVTASLDTFTQSIDTDKNIALNCPFLDMPHFIQGVTSPLLSKNAWFIADTNALPFKNESIACFIGLAVLENADNPLEALYEIARVLKPNARAWVGCIRRDSAWQNAHAAPLFGANEGLSTTECLSLFAEAGLSIEHMNGALYTAPQSHYGMMADVKEHIGQALLPFGYGLHMMKAVKIVHAPVTPSGGVKMRARFNPAQNPNYA